MPGSCGGGTAGWHHRRARVVATHESFAGERVEAPAPGMQAMIDASLVPWLGHLKATAEAG
jgi:hypothetical protein